MRGKKTIPDEQIIALISEGLANKEIAARLGAKHRTVEKIVSTLLKKHGCRNRVELAMNWKNQQL